MNNDDVKEAWRRMAAAGLRAPDELGPDALPVWADVLSGCSREEVLEATGAWIASGARFFPTAGQLAVAVMHGRPQRHRVVAAAGEWARLRGRAETAAQRQRAIDLLDQAIAERGHCLELVRCEATCPVCAAAIMRRANELARAEP